MFCNPNLGISVLTVSPFSPVVTALISVENTSTSEVSGGTTNSPGFTVKCTAVDFTTSPFTAKIGIS